MSSHYMLCAVCVCYAVNALAASSSACYLFIHSFIYYATEAAHITLQTLPYIPTDQRI